MFEINFPSKSIFTPSISLKLHNSSISRELRDSILEIVLKEEQNIIDNVPPSDPNDKNWMTGRLWNYNFLDLDYDSVRELKNYIKSQYVDFMNQLGYEPEKVYIQCWVNIIRNDGRSIVPHHHADGHSSTKDAPQDYSYLSGNLCIQTENTSTWFRNPFLDKMCAPIQNIDGELILFPSFVVHWTDKNLSDKPRVTISFDLITEEFYNIVDGKNYREL